MSSKPSSIPTAGPGGIAPTPQNTPLNTAPLTSALSKPTVPTIGEEDVEDGPPPETPPGQSGADFAGLGELNLHSDPDWWLIVESVSGARGRSAILGMVQQRLEGLMGQSSGYIEGLPSGTKKRVLALKGVQSQYEDLQLKYKKECLELERKVRPVGKRSQIN
jgi:nucleosome assembly protein 1-like 1